MKLEGKIALVTGAAQGIGEATARCLAEEGAYVIINDVRDQYQLLNSLQAKIGFDRSMIFPGDVSLPQMVRSMFEAAIGWKGGLDIVVANAALSIREPLLSADWGGVQRTWEVTVNGVFHTCQAAARQMMKQSKGGRIIVIGSVLSEVPFPTNGAYNMAKAATRQMARTMALELAPYVNVNVIAPGHIDTPGERQLSTEEELKNAGKRIPCRRLGRAEEIGKAVVFLASDDAAYITGATLTIDGGVSLRLGL